MKYIRVRATVEGKERTIVFAISENAKDRDNFICDDESYKDITRDLADIPMMTEDIDQRTYFIETYNEMAQSVVITLIGAEIKMGDMPAFIRALMIGQEVSPIVHGAKKFESTIAELGITDIPMPEVLKSVATGKISKTLAYDYAKENNIFTEEELAPLYAKLEPHNEEDCAKCSATGCDIRKAEYNSSKSEKQEQDELLDAVKKGI